MAIEISETKLDLWGKLANEFQSDIDYVCCTSIFISPTLTLKLSSPVLSGSIKDETHLDSQGNML